MSAPGSKPSAKEWTLFVCPQCGITHLELEAFRHGHCAYCCARAERVRVAPVEALRLERELLVREQAAHAATASRYEKALREIAGLKHDSPGIRLVQARKMARAVLGSGGRPEKETG